MFEEPKILKDFNFFDFMFWNFFSWNWCVSFVKTKSYFVLKNIPDDSRFLFVPVSLKM